MRDGQATRRRVLQAAAAEFAQHGIAGARVDRIAAAAATSKAQMYDYFGNKDGLFDAVFAEHTAAVMDAVPFTAQDLPGYAARLYDAHRKHPEFVRLAGWARLERVPTGDLIPDAAGHEAKLQALRQAQADGSIDPALDPSQVLSLVVAMAMTWSAISVVRTTTSADSASVHADRKRFLSEMVRRATSIPAAAPQGSERR
ncbi:TetR family transcriptional regulator [Kineococcus sp. T13]|uniref:TetR family transcriptional regulator n=1 Tax=Kineococcus vitellinus TaxID=2696565 RepID=UPI001412129F|nr:TetR family transcriptional regulator [Kineococcus vitellinus]